MLYDGITSQNGPNHAQHALMVRLGRLLLSKGERERERDREIERERNVRVTKTERVTTK